ncbi:ATP-binding protein [Gracilimonas sp.]|uniref:ATP-binding protein n=1 Tax=Gracilimonas sp. TaxID=1974203 RepID=UPI003D0F32B8
MYYLEYILCNNFIYTSNIDGFLGGITLTSLLMKITGTFKRDVDELQNIFDFLKKNWAGYEVNGNDQRKIELSVEEIFMNMVRHNPNAEFDIKLIVEKKNRKIILSLSDFEEKPFDITQARDVDFEEYFRQKKSGGLGIHLVKEIMDDIKFVHRNGISTITITKLI